jgi:molybdopterin-guanine dinucleotide biosynthesis protein A
VKAAVLTGGASRRMGTPKADLLVEGAPMAVRVADAARSAGATAVAAVGRPVEGLEHLVEDEPGAGPLAALLAALAWAAGDTVLVLGCDLIAPSAAAMRSVVDELDADADADAAVPVVDGRAQWLHGAWRSRDATIATLQQAFAGGERSLHGAAEALRVHRVASDDGAPFRDADRPEDLPPGSVPGSGPG